MASIPTRTPARSSHRLEVSAGSVGRPAHTGPALPPPFLFPGGEDDIFCDPFGDFLPSRR